MRVSAVVVACFLASARALAKDSDPNVLSSAQTLASPFKPPQVFKNINLSRNINLEKAYVKEAITVVVENIDSAPQTEYFVPFSADLISHVGGFQAGDKKSPQISYVCNIFEYDATSSPQFYRVTFSEPLAPKAQKTLVISYHLLSSLAPLPAEVSQTEKQHLLFAFSTSCPSAYHTVTQKTKIKFAGVDIPDYTGKPERQGSTFTYGPFENIPAGAETEASVRYEFTKPIIHARTLERDIEVSHWGGNIAFEERYQLTNKGASLANHFSRVSWAQQQHYSPTTRAIKELNVPLKVGSINPYFTDDIGNISTSRFRSSTKEAHLYLKPRYPLFGGWSFPFRIGWDSSLHGFLRSRLGEGYVLKVPFLEGPKMSEGVSYEQVTLRIILPEGATNVEFESAVPVLSSAISKYKTYMDTLGRTTLTLRAINVIDESRDKDLIVTYDYPMFAGMRKAVDHFRCHVWRLRNRMGCWKPGYEDRKKGIRLSFAGQEIV